MKLAVLASGRGSNLQALATAIDQGHCAASICAVISDRAQAPALAFARDRALPTAVVLPKDYGSRAEWDQALAQTLGAFAPDLVVLAGFMRIVGSAVLGRFGHRIVNVHPSLLPAFPGLDAPAQAIAKGVAITGCTVHLVDAGVDTGPILAQAALPVLDGDDAAQLHARIQEVEHVLLPAVIHAIARGALRLGDAGTRPRHAPPPSVEAFCQVWPPLL
jgi:phosphoribosylglycinamide formyltransferase-1